MRIDHCGNGDCHGVGVQLLRSPDRKDWDENSAGTGAGGCVGEGRVGDGRALTGRYGGAEIFKIHQYSLRPAIVAEPVSEITGRFQ